MTQPTLFVATIAHYLLDREGRPVDETREEVTGLSTAEAGALHASHVALWRQLGYSVREGDGWATGAAADAFGHLSIDRMLPGEAA